MQKRHTIPHGGVLYNVAQKGGDPETHAFNSTSKKGINLVILKIDVGCVSCIW